MDWHEAAWHGQQVGASFCVTSSPTHLSDWIRASFCVMSFLPPPPALGFPNPLGMSLESVPSGNSARATTVLQRGCQRGVSSKAGGESFRQQQATCNKIKHRVRQLGSEARGRRAVDVIADVSPRAILRAVKRTCQNPHLHGA